MQSWKVQNKAKIMQIARVHTWTMGHASSSGMIDAAYIEWYNVLMCVCSDLQVAIFRVG